MSEALLVLQRVADRWAGAEAAAVSERHRRDHQPAEDWVSVYRAGRRQFLSRDVDRSAAGARAGECGEARRADGDSGRAVSVDGRAGEAAEGHGVLYADHDGGG